MWQDSLSQGKSSISKGKKIQAQYRSGKQAGMANAGKELIALNMQIGFVISKVKSQSSKKINKS